MTKKVRRKKQSTLRWVWRMTEFRPKDDRVELPWKVRGFYALLSEEGHRKKRYHVEYVGIADDLRRRLNQHASGSKKRRWDHFSVFQVWPNITEEEIREIEGILRHVYRKDPHASGMNKQRRMNMLGRVRVPLLRWTSEIPIRGEIDKARAKRARNGPRKVGRKRRNIKRRRG